MSDRGPWSTEDFDAMSWHDAHVHGLRLEHFTEVEGAADLVLDIDYILNWQKAGTGFLFTVSQAVLQFHKVTSLKLELNYATPSAGMCPFSIAAVEREVHIAPNGLRSHRWRIPVNWPEGLLEFEAPSFTQTLVGEPHVQSDQFLTPEKRHGTVAV
jgi:hypothetical protein